MIPLTLILAALVLLISVDATAAGDSHQVAPVRTDDDQISLNR